MAHNGPHPENNTVSPSAQQSMKIFSPPPPPRADPLGNNRAQKAIGNHEQWGKHSTVTHCPLHTWRKYYTAKRPPSTA